MSRMSRFDELCDLMTDCDEAGDIAFREQCAALNRDDNVGVALWADLCRDAFAEWHRLHAERMALFA